MSHPSLNEEGIRYMLQRLRHLEQENKKLKAMAQGFDAAFEDVKRLKDALRQAKDDYLWGGSEDINGDLIPGSPIETIDQALGHISCNSKI